jgi:hypothetical protein
VIAFTTLAHVIRDGLPALGSTHLARAAGGLAVTAGGLLFFPWPTALVLGLAITAGFYTDMRHGEANKGDWRDGIISGCASLTPIAAAAVGLHMSPWWALLVLAGLAKPPIWQLAWRLDPGRFTKRVPAWAAPLAEPTRVAAIMWGALVGGLLIIVATTGARHAF